MGTSGGSLVFVLYNSLRIGWSARGMYRQSMETSFRGTELVKQPLNRWAWAHYVSQKDVGNESKQASVVQGLYKSL